MSFPPPTYPFAHTRFNHMPLTLWAVGGTFPLFLTAKSLFTFLSTKIWIKMWRIYFLDVYLKICSPDGREFGF